MKSGVPAAQEQGFQADASFPEEKTIGELEQNAAFMGSMPTDVTVSQDGCIEVVLKP